MASIRAFCDCTICGKQFCKSTGTGQALYFHMKIEHQMEHEKAFSAAGDSLNHNVVFWEYTARGAAF